MEAVPIRATLKRLQGYWFGKIDGGFSANLEVTNRGTITENSWVRNDLGVDLTYCWLIISQADRIGGMSRNQRINLYQIGRTLVSGGGTYLLGDESVQRSDRSKWPRLEDLHKEWAGRFMAVGGGRWGQKAETPKFEMNRFRTALMFLTTLDEYSEFDATGHVRGLDRSHGLNLDRCHLLTKDTAMVIGFADTPGPARLEVKPAGSDDARWRAVEPERGLTMFRFIVPVTRVADW